MRKGQAPGGGERELTDIATSLRLAPDFITRADALINRIRRVPEYAAMGPMDRSKVLRLAIAKGLEVLETEHAGTLKGARKP